jgi:hypothetical protein
MRTATGLMVIALGAILAFAVRGHPSFVNLQIAGWVIMLTGIAGLILPRRSYGSLRSRLVLRPLRRRPPVNRTRYWPNRIHRVRRAGSPVMATASEGPVMAEPATTVGQPAGEVGEEFIEEVVAEPAPTAGEPAGASCGMT